MQQAAVYDLCVAPPHEPDGARFTHAEFVIYREGYQLALVMALRVMEAAERRYKLVTQTKRLATRRKNQAARAEAHGGQASNHDDEG